jgi:hypothetical protein
VASKAELRDQVLEYLGKKVIGQPAANNLQVDIEQAIDEVYADLKRDHILTWPTTGEVPNDCLPYVKYLVGFSRSTGLSPERYQRVLMNASSAKRELRKIVAPEYSPIDEAVDY